MNLTDRERGSEHRGLPVQTASLSAGQERGRMNHGQRRRLRRAHLQPHSAFPAAAAAAPLDGEIESGRESPSGHGRVNSLAIVHRGSVHSVSAFASPSMCRSPGPSCENNGNGGKVGPARVYTTPATSSTSPGPRNEESKSMSLTPNNRSADSLAFFRRVEYDSNGMPVMSPISLQNRLNLRLAGSTLMNYRSGADGRLHTSPRAAHIVACSSRLISLANDARDRLDHVLARCKANPVVSWMPESFYIHTAFDIRVVCTTAKGIYYAVPYVLLIPGWGLATAADAGSATIAYTVHAALHVFEAGKGIYAGKTTVRERTFDASLRMLFVAGKAIDWGFRTFFESVDNVVPPVFNGILWTTKEFFNIIAVTCNKLEGDATRTAKDYPEIKEWCSSVEAGASRVGAALDSAVKQAGSYIKLKAKAAWKSFTSLFY